MESLFSTIPGRGVVFAAEGEEVRVTTRESGEKAKMALKHRNS